MALQGRLIFRNQTATAGWSFTFGVGIAPAQAVITFDPSANLSNVVGNMVLIMGSTAITFVDCRSTRVTRTNAKMLQVSIQDRRWKWAFGRIDGNYNEKSKEDGVEVIKREQTPQQLANLLLNSMGETGFNTTQLPNLARPTVDWVSSNPAQELQSLCSSLGSMVVLNPLTDRVEIHRIGVGSGNLPTSSKRIQNSPAVLLQVRPDEIRVIGGPALFQVPMILDEPVGQDTDGEIKPIDDLSYTPAGGWEDQNPFDFSNVEGTYDDNGKTVKKIDLAAANVWKKYRITRLEGGGFTPQSLIGTGLEPQSLDDIDIQDHQIRKKKFPVGEKRLRPIVVGQFHDNELTYENTPKGTQVKHSFSIDAEQGIVEFSEPMFISFGGGAMILPAILVLHTAFIARRDGVRTRHEEFRTSSGQTYGTGPMVLHHPEIIREVIEGYGDDDSDNIDDIIAESAHYLDAVSQRFSAGGSTDALYDGIHAASLDGINRQITWSGGGTRPATTRVSQNQEHSPYVPTFESVERSEERDRLAKGFLIVNPKAIS